MPELPTLNPVRQRFPTRRPRHPEPYGVVSLMPLLGEETESLAAAEERWG